MNLSYWIINVNIVNETMFTILFNIKTEIYHSVIRLMKNKVYRRI